MMFYTGSLFPATRTVCSWRSTDRGIARPSRSRGSAWYSCRWSGKTGPHQDFAVDFSDAGGPGRDGRLHRPTGLAQGSDGSLYISDDVGGTIYKVSYKGK
jgi:glucose/arabinose dehydrogenase